jgi:Na+-transporting methylmalonyl-CoA/oxaloacetate decarboxylase gamma subunit
MDSLDLLIFIVVTSVLVVVAAVGKDVLKDYLEEKKEERAAQKEKDEKFNEWALRVLTVAGLHKNAHAIYRREPGSHRRVRV